MLNKVKENIGKFFSKSVKVEETLIGSKAVFILEHQHLHIGTLELNDGVWSFEYSEVYKHLLKKAMDSGDTESIVKPLFAFPEIEHIYTSPVLWSFFTGRIPGLKQPDVQKIMKSDGIKSTDLVTLLDRFGQKTISSPFELHLAPA
jgi:hypothetical protein